MTLGLLGTANVDLDPKRTAKHLAQLIRQSPVEPPARRRRRRIGEAEIDPPDASASRDDRFSPKRKVQIDRLQQIVWDRRSRSFIWFTKNALAAIGASVRNGKAVVLYPHAYWNADQIQLTAELARTIP